MAEDRIINRPEEKDELSPELLAFNKSEEIEKIGKIEDKAVLRLTAENLCLIYNEAIQTGSFNLAKPIEEAITEAVNRYTQLSREECYKAVLATEDPMYSAVLQLTFPSIRAKDNKEGDEKIPVRVIEDIEKAIDLAALHKRANGGIGKDKNWIRIGEKLNFVLTAAKAVDLGIDPKEINDSYAMSEIAHSIDLGRTPCSKTNILRTLQTVVTAMIGEEYKATSHDVNFLLSIFSKKGRAALSVNCANHKFMRSYLAEICHRIVTGKTYTVEYKKAK